MPNDELPTFHAFAKMVADNAGSNFASHSEAPVDEPETAEFLQARAERFTSNGQNFPLFLADNLTVDFGGPNFNEHTFIAPLAASGNDQFFDALIDALGLNNLLSEIGSPTRVGSSALGLMVRRDIDITVTCKKLDEGTHRAVVEPGGKLAMHASIGSVQFRNDTGIWNNAVEEYPDGLYLGVTCRDETGRDWTFDIWFIDEPERQPDLKHLRTIPLKLTTSARQSILAIKTALADGSCSGRRPSSFQVYEAVLERGVTSLSEFEDWLKGTRQPEFYVFATKNSSALDNCKPSSRFVK